MCRGWEVEVEAEAEVKVGFLRVRWGAGFPLCSLCFSVIPVTPAVPSSVSLASVRQSPLRLFNQLKPLLREIHFCNLSLFNNINSNPINRFIAKPKYLLMIYNRIALHYPVQ